MFELLMAMEQSKHYYAKNRFSGLSYGGHAPRAGDHMRQRDENRIKYTPSAEDATVTSKGIAPDVGDATHTTND